VCERFNLKLPSVKNNFYENTSYINAQLLAYEQIRELEEMELAVGGFIKKTFK